MRRLALLSVLAVTLLGCGGEVGDGWELGQEQHGQHTALQVDVDGDQLLRAAIAPEQPHRLRPAIDPDPGEASSTLHPDHYTLSDDEFCGHTGCPADETAPCEPHNAGVAKPMCACRVRGYLFVCH